MSFKLTGEVYKIEVQIDKDKVNVEITSHIGKRAGKQGYAAAVPDIIVFCEKLFLNVMEDYIGNDHQPNKYQRKGTRKWSLGKLIAEFSFQHIQTIDIEGVIELVVYTHIITKS